MFNRNWAEKKTMLKWHVHERAAVLSLDLNIYTTMHDHRALYKKAAKHID